MTAVLKVYSDVIDALDAGNISLLALLDLTAAFDTVDHNFLLQRLQRSFGIYATVLRWFESHIPVELKLSIYLVQQHCHVH